MTTIGLTMFTFSLFKRSSLTNFTLLLRSNAIFDSSNPFISIIYASNHTTRLSTSTKAPFYHLDLATTLLAPLTSMIGSICIDISSAKYQSTLSIAE